MKALSYLIGLFLAIWLISLVYGCTKPSMVSILKPPVKASVLTDTLNFYVYAEHFDSIHAFPYNSVEIKVIGTNDSIEVLVFDNLAHTYKNYVLDTTTNHRQVKDDSTYTRLPIHHAGDTVKYYVINSTGKLHIADFYYNGTGFVRTWESSIFYPYGISGDHISPGYVNTIYIP